MKIYLVGGAVRDKLLHLPVTENDWVVVGASVDDMLKLKYRPVGKDFPVFLHPVTNEEYALARTERKVKKGYTGFNFDTSPTVTLEEDLKRRDLTINAIAKDEQGNLIDPYGGQQDLENKILRHVSEAFVEDPVRVLRVARFAARFYSLGFRVAPETMMLMQTMVASGEIDALVAERVWKELERALGEENPEQFFLVLEEAHALKKLFPQIKKSSLSVLAKSAHKTADTQIRFAVLCHDMTEAELKLVCDRYRVPSDYRDLALLVVRQINNYKNAEKLSNEDILKLLSQVDAFRRPERFEKFLLACDIIFEKNAAFFKKCFELIKTVDVAALMKQGFEGKQLADKINEERIAKLKSRNQ